MEQSEFLNYLANELSTYNQIAIADTQARFEKKQYINGLMKASRFFGVTYESIKEVIDTQLKEQIDFLNASGRTDELYNIPAYIRENIDSQI